MDVRPLTDDELPASLPVINTALLVRPRPPEDFEAHRTSFEPGRTHGAFDDRGRLVGVAGAFTFDLTVPGGRRLPAAGVTRVGVLPTDTRRGALRALMTAQLRDVRERGEAVAVLRASEATIYGRFGYGLASLSADTEVRRERGSLRRDAPGAATALEVVPTARAAEVLPALYDEVTRRRPGTVSRPLWWWQRFLGLDVPEGKDPPTYVVLADGGYAWYSVPNPDDWGPQGKTVDVHELVAADVATAADLWRFLLGLDLVGTVRRSGGPVDEPLRWLLADARALRTTKVVDELWVRLVDVAAALGARRYATDGRLVLEVRDTAPEDSTGCYELAASDGGADCRRVDAAPDLVLDGATLAAAYLGGVRLGHLAGAGLVEERTGGAVARADALFSTLQAPWCGTWF